VILPLWLWAGIRDIVDIDIYSFPCIADMLTLYIWLYPCTTSHLGHIMKVTPWLGWVVFPLILPFYTKRRSYKGQTQLPMVNNNDEQHTPRNTNKGNHTTITDV
jgi:hypothetical protein